MYQTAGMDCKKKKSCSKMIPLKTEVCETPRCHSQLIVRFRNSNARSRNFNSSSVSDDRIFSFLRIYRIRIKKIVGLELIITLAGSPVSARRVQGWPLPDSNGSPIVNTDPNSQACQLCLSLTSTYLKNTYHCGGYFSVGKQLSCGEGIFLQGVFFLLHPLPNMSYMRSGTRYDDKLYSSFYE